MRGALKFGATLQSAGTKAENAVTALALLAIVLLPLIEVVARALIGLGIPGSIDYVRHLTLWVAFLGAGVAARDGKHLSLGFAAFLRGRWRLAASIVAGSVATAVAFLLAWASLEMVRADSIMTSTLGGVIPQWVAEVIMPIGFTIIGAR
ncbi:MAG: TRAP transporter small permease, partial [Acidiferrobacterales bacterium]